MESNSEDRTRSESGSYKLEGNQASWMCRVLFTKLHKDSPKNDFVLLLG